MSCGVAKAIYIVGVEDDLYISRCCLLKGHLLNKNNLNLEEEIKKIPSKNELILTDPDAGQCNFFCDIKEGAEAISFSILHMCNLRCYHCCAGMSLKTNRKLYAANFSKNKKTLFMLLDQCKNIKLNNIILDGSGEIFLCYKDLFKWLSTLNKDFIKNITFSTNGTLLFKDRIDALKQLSDKTGVNYHFDVSFDGITKEIYERSRVGANFEKTLDNILNIKNTFGEKNISIVFTLKETNKPHNIKDIKLFFYKYGFEKVCFHSDILDHSIKLPIEEYWS